MTVQEDQHKREALVIFMPSGRRGRFPLGITLLDAARKLGVYVESVCGGRGICGRCQVLPSFGHFAKHGISSSSAHLSTVNEVELRYAEKRVLSADRRLSCQAKITGDLVIDVPTDTAVNNQVVRKRAEARNIVRDCATHLYYVELPLPDMERPLGDLDRIAEHLVRDFSIDVPDVDISVLDKVQPALKAGGGKVTMAVHKDARQSIVAAIWPGYRERLFGIACDIGSTTIACHLVDLMSGRTVASVGTSNPQIRFGEDLMSRVSYVMMNADGREALTGTVRESVNTLMHRVAAEGGATPDEVLEVTFVGNPIMHHLLLGVDPTPLGQAPFALAVSSAMTLRASDLGLNMHPSARAYILPCIAGHVGADAAAVALAESPHKGDETTLIVDIGTNAEILLGNRRRLLAASSPTGPAFEGAQISCGQRAAPGAIERVRIDAATLEPRIRVIGSDLWSNEPGFAESTAAFGVTGICGSGIIEALAEMFLAGIIRVDGTIDGALAARTGRVVADGRTFSYQLWREPHALTITQTDVRAIQLAKGALYAGCRLLMESLNTKKIDRIKLAGGFGSHIDPKYAMILGLIPDCDLTRVEAVGNAAGTGARMALLNRGHRREIEELVGRIEKIETALEPNFQALFIDAMGFPNSADAFPELGKVVDLPARGAIADAAMRAMGRRRRRRSGDGSAE
jgi:uncharacterized 2Fe-2S/4Fe-4S cluster protein (DUF4445 family)